MRTSVMERVDSYKLSHWQQYPPGTENINSYIEARKGGDYDHTLFFGLQAFIKEYLVGDRVFLDSLERMQEFAKMHGVPFNFQGWNEILRNKKQQLPLIIEAVPEGTIVPAGNVLVQIRATDPRFYWLVSYLETSLLRAVWYPTTVATISYNIKQVIKKYLDLTCDNPDAELPFKLHDFGARGVSSSESAGLGGMAHLVNFMGSDTIEGILAARKYYNEPMAGFSIPASEHSTITAWGAKNELAAHKNMLDKFAKPGAIVASVSDSYDLLDCLKNIWGSALKEQVINSGATVVIRPDSGDPVLTLSQCLLHLRKDFGTITNKKGYEVLNNVRVIWGDGINQNSITKILEAVESWGFSTENVAFGMGGALLQHGNRDTIRFAMKASAIKINGQWQGISKSPKTDPSKASKSGILSLIYSEEKGYETLSGADCVKDLLRPVFEDGQLLVEDDFATIRSRASIK